MPAKFCLKFCDMLNMLNLGFWSYCDNLNLLSYFYFKSCNLMETLLEQNLEKEFEALYCQCAGKTIILHKLHARMLFVIAPCHLLEF